MFDYNRRALIYLCKSKRQHRKRERRERGQRVRTKLQLPEVNRSKTAELSHLNFDAVQLSGKRKNPQLVIRLNSWRQMATSALQQVMPS